MASSRDLLNFKEIIISMETLYKENSDLSDFSNLPELAKMGRLEVEARDTLISDELANTNETFKKFNLLCKQLSELNVGKNWSDTLHALVISVTPTTDFKNATNAFKAYAKIKYEALVSPTDANKAAVKKEYDEMMAALNKNKISFQALKKKLKEINPPDQLLKKLVLIEDQLNAIRKLNISQIKINIDLLQELILTAKNILNSANRNIEISNKRVEQVREGIQILGASIVEATKVKTVLKETKPAPADTAVAKNPNTMYSQKLAGKDEVSCAKPSGPTSLGLYKSST